MPAREAIPANWAELPDEQLLDLRLSDLPLSLAGTVMETRLAQLRSELLARGLDFPIHFYLASEWFTADGHASMAVPFYLAHPRLEKLEQAQMLAVEGGEHEWCMRILRHEAGHVIDNAYKLRLPPAAPRAVRQVVGSLSGVLHAEAVQQELRPAPRSLVRAEPSRRGLRRDLRAVADAAVELAAALRRAGRRSRSSSTWTS